MASKTYQNQRHKIRTLCTLDSQDIDLSDIKLVSFSKPKKKSINNKRYSIMNHSKIKKSDSTQFDKQTHSHSVSKTPKNAHNKYQRLKTQHNRVSKKFDDFDGLESRIWKQIKSRFSNNYDKEYPVKTYQLLQIVSETDNQIKYQAKSLENYNLLIVRKSKTRQAKQFFLKQIQMKKQIEKIPSLFRKNLTKLRSYEKSSKDWSLVYSYCGINLDWDNLAHTQLMKKSCRNNYQILKHIIKQIAKAILGLSKLGYVHGSIGNESVFYLLEEENKSIKLEKDIKVGNFQYAFVLGQKKKQILSLKRNFTTPPQILNYIMFEEGVEGFDRDYLEYLSSYHQPWKIDIWALGIYILEMLLTVPFSTTGLSLRHMLDFSRNIISNYSYTLSQLQENKSLYDLVLRMLSSNPSQRPNPKEIIYLL